MEPWLDSLSEDWDSEPRHSSPASLRKSNNNSNSGTRSFSQSKTRIPHLSQSLRKDSVNGSFLRPRSTRGIAKANGNAVLSEITASNFNSMSNAARHAPPKQRAGSLPRRVSASLSDSQNSVQHHEVDTTTHETPGWKKRLAQGDNIASDGCDLFSPSKLEGIFSQPDPHSDAENDRSVSHKDSIPWKSLNTFQKPAAPPQHQSFRTSRSKTQFMEALEEASESEDDIEPAPDMSAISSDIIRTSDIQGIVQRRMTGFERDHAGRGRYASAERIQSQACRDPRWRTSSGQEEIRNEIISPVTASVRDTMRERAVRESVDLDPESLRKKLLGANTDAFRRPSSSSSDRDISYDGNGNHVVLQLHEEYLADLTSQSLPEDLSMGTQGYASNTSIVKTRPESAFDNDLRNKQISASLAQRARDLDTRDSSTHDIPSSPPIFAFFDSKIRDAVEAENSLSVDAQDTSVVRLDVNHNEKASSRSPLKLFGNRDTYTNNKLMRYLSQYEEDRIRLSDGRHSVGGESSLDQHDRGLRMSQFGQGELDSFNFEQQAATPQIDFRTNPAASTKVARDITARVRIRKSSHATGLPRRESVVQESDSKVKRTPSSPAKERTPKRRRTLLKDEIFVNGTGIEVEIHQMSDGKAVAGRKRKDARSGEGGVQADPDTLASRVILRPRPGSRKVSDASQPRPASSPTSDPGESPLMELTEALAAELASFAQGVPAANPRSRNTSLATMDYMEEANRVMEIIRKRGKQKPKLSGIQEPEGLSEVDPDVILDLELDDDSTKDSFSRPPSREGPLKPQVDRRHAKHDPQVANHLSKYKESEDLELLTSTSVVGTTNRIDNEAAEYAALVPVPAEDQESSPPNMRILNDADVLRKRKHSDSTPQCQNSIDRSTESSNGRTLSSETSNSSGQRGMITSGTVSIPDHVGTMTFDHEKQIWVKQQLSKPNTAVPLDDRSVTGRELTAEDDPFEDIPDLSFDEQREAALRKATRATKPAPGIGAIRQLGAHHKPRIANADHIMESSTEQSPEHLSPSATPIDARTKDNRAYVESAVQSKMNNAEVAKHEEQLLEGIPSTVPESQIAPNKQPRAVTIAFSSPIATHMTERNPNDESASDLDDEDFLPPEDSDDEVEDRPVANSSRHLNNYTGASSIRHEQYRSMTLNRRPVSRIEERDEEDDDDRNGLSLVHVQEPAQATPQSGKYIAPSTQVSAYKGSSMLCLTPLSDFTMHKDDNNHQNDQSFVAPRPHPKALLQAHGSLALTVDAIVKAITDTVSTEMFWENLRRLNLSEKNLTSLHGLNQYCPSLEKLTLAKNSISQLNGLPATLLSLDLTSNCVNDFTSWSNLQNLQYVDVSNNQLESLEAFRSLYHLRTLKARNNRLRDMEGVLDMSGLIELDVSGNGLDDVDFTRAELVYLEKLDMSRNQLTDVCGLHSLTSLKVLNIDSNRLTEVSITKPIPCLQTLTVSQNQLEAFDLENVPALRTLDVDNNCLTDLVGLSEAQYLRKLSAREQRDSTHIISNILSRANECEEIRLSSNILPGGMLSLPAYPHYNLRVLELAGCGVHMLPRSFGDYFPNCRELNLNFNALDDLTPLLGCVKAQRLLLCGNRLKRLRRTCLTLARLPVLHRLDLRDNPLTIGFYAPGYYDEKQINHFVLPARSENKDNKWLQTLDETTLLKRRMLELLLADRCKSLQELDGAVFGGQDALDSETSWAPLTAKGVLVKAIEACPTHVSEMQAPTTELGCADVPSVIRSVGERSLQME